MYARSTTITAHPSFIDAGITHFHLFVMPELAELDGCEGMSLIVDRDGGRCIATSSWRDEASMAASEGRVRDLRSRAAEVLHGDATISRWEIAALHRDHHTSRGAAMRVAWMRIEPSALARAVETFKTTAMPAMEGLEGFCSASMLTDRASGRAVVSVSFDSREAAFHNRAESERMRAAGMKAMGAQLLDVAEFELAIAHLHVPEMA